MKTKFSLVFDVREDGTKVWAAECQRCGGMVVGELYPQVTLVKLAPGSPPLSPSQFDQLRQMLRRAWDEARRTGTPIVIADDRFVVESVNDHGDVQRALEAHAEKCGSSTRERPPATSMPGPGEPRG